MTTTESQSHQGWPPEPDMKLPVGKTRSDCRHYRRCEWLISCAPEETACDWSPSRFREVNA